ncbi:hypothetical protein L596_014554 [Steinernema carpocapsae]|uniref:Uncharacterized protein n=1 Tax=Steinernema carpocapsae TaxID=34508 RepID=A0A4U5NCS8_STECR|nr:hypothetical protein L596_014554 [Steinernema carpocapsae]
MLKYKKCYNQVPFHCTANAIQMWKQIDMAIADSFLHVSKLNSNRVKIPEHCDWAITGAPTGIEEQEPTVTVFTLAPLEAPTSTVNSKSIEEFEEFAKMQRNRTLRREENRTEFLEVETPELGEELAEGEADDREDAQEKKVYTEEPELANGTTTTVVRYFENFLQNSAFGRRPFLKRNFWWCAVVAFVLDW